ncbi:hypothetical protein PANA5342_1198 [Pantoea ananatis LMG 5342]|nr:hypothetical protein PANA5342_1198 [Pantoea ananatis LMG 5342]
MSAVPKAAYDNSVKSSWQSLTLFLRRLSEISTVDDAK